MARIPRGKIARAVVFVLVVALVVAGATAVPYLRTQSGAEGPADYSEYRASALVPDRASSQGHPTAERVEDPGVVLVDKAHANRFTESEIQPLLSAIAATGYRVEFLRPSDDFDRALSGADALLVVDPALRYTTEEVDRVEEFVESGGRLAMLGEPTQTALQGSGAFVSLATVRNRMAPLSTRFGIDFGASYLYNMETRDGNFRNVFADPAGNTALTRGIDRTAFYTATRVEATGGSRILVAVDGTRLDKTDAPGEYPIAVRKGNVLAVGDKTFLDRGNYNVADNDRLVGNIATFLASGERSRTLLDYPYVVDRDPEIAYTSAGLLDAAQTVAGDFRSIGDEPTLSMKPGAGSGVDADVLITTYDHVETHDLEAGVSVSDGRVEVPGYASDTTGVIVFRAPEDGIDLLIVVSGPEKARRAASILTGGELEGYAIGDRTAVVRTDSVVANESVS